MVKFCIQYKNIYSFWILKDLFITKSNLMNQFTNFFFNLRKRKYFWPIIFYHLKAKHDTIHIIWLADGENFLGKQNILPWIPIDNMFTLNFGSGACILQGHVVVVVTDHIQKAIFFFFLNKNCTLEKKEKRPRYI